MKDFAPGMVRDEKGLIHFPNDSTIRRELFVGESFKHQAKANLYMVQALIEFCSEPGQRVMDITAGTGSILLARHTGRAVTAIELSPKYFSWICQSAEKQGLQQGSDLLLLNGDCRDFLPIPGHQAIIFSPPYAQALNSGGGILSREKELMNGLEDYRADPRNLSTLSTFFYNIEMGKIYKQCWDSLKPGGLLALIIKDLIRDGERVGLSVSAGRNMIKAGFLPYAWFRWKPPGHMFVNIKRSKGETVVEEEELVIMQKPEAS